MFKVSLNPLFMQRLVRYSKFKRKVKAEFFYRDSRNIEMNLKIDVGREETGKIIPRLRAVVALLKDLEEIPTIQMVAHSHRQL